MKKITIYISLLAAALLGSCVGDLDQFPKTQSTSNSVYQEFDNYKSVLAKLYASYVIAGQEKGGEDADIVSNSGENCDYLRLLFNMQEVPTEEIAYTWLEGNNMTGLAYMQWDVNDIWVSDMYYRIYYTIALCNEFLRNSTEGDIARFSAAEQEQIRHYTREARFLRALAYYHAMDLYGAVPFVDENDPVGAFTPPRYTADQIFEYVESELLDIYPDMPTASEVEYARAGKSAALTLLARLYLNAEVYTSKQYYTECITACKEIIADGYSLEPDYAKLFNASNNLRTNEIIFAFAVDSEHTVSWGSTTYLVCGAVGTVSTQNPYDYGVETPWGMFRCRPELPAKFGNVDLTSDSRAMFWTDGQEDYLTDITNQRQGYFVEKWSNLTDAGNMSSNTQTDGVDTDFPFFRLAEVYLMYAEAVLRGGSGGTTAEALNYINLLRQRAYGDQSGNISQADLTLDFIIDERARELYWECHRRTDLIRFGLFTGGSYLWQFKGGAVDGRATDSKYNIYPIPYTELSANPNLYNENY